MSHTGPERPWLTQYAPGVPADFEPEVRNGVELFARGAIRRPDGAALHYFDSTLTHQETRALAQALAAAFRDLGIRPGDRVALYLQNMPQFVLSLEAIWLLGAIAVPVNPMLKTRELAYQLRDCGAKLIVCLQSLYGTVEAALPETAVEHVVTTSELDFLNGTSVPAVLSDSHRIETPNAHDFLELSARHRGVVAEPADPAPDEPAILGYTSGTTGAPKGAMNTHRNITYNAEVYHRFMGVGDDDVVMGMAPLFHITGLIGHIAIARFCAAPLVLFCRFDAQEMLRLVEKWRGTFSIGALTAYIALLDNPDLARYDISSLTKIFSGGAPVYPAVVERFEQATGRYIHNAYGLTEVTSPSHSTPLGKRAPVDPDSGALSVGVPVCGTDSKIVDIATDRELPPGETGEIVTRGPMVVPGYWGKPDETAHAIRDGWLHTGDVGKRDDEGWFYLLDRAKDMIVAAGYKVWPREVEDVLHEHPAVSEAAVIGVPDEYRGETVKAYVTLKPGSGDLAPDDLIAHCKSVLAAYKYPRIVEIVDEIPKTATGKVLRRVLREQGGSEPT